MKAEPATAATATGVLSQAQGGARCCLPSKHGATVLPGAGSKRCEQDWKNKARALPRQNGWDFRELTPTFPNTHTHPISLLLRSQDLVASNNSHHFLVSHAFVGQECRRPLAEGVLAGLLHAGSLRPPPESPPGAWWGLPPHLPASGPPVLQSPRERPECSPDLASGRTVWLQVSHSRKQISPHRLTGPGSF